MSNESFPNNTPTMGVHCSAGLRDNLSCLAKITFQQTLLELGHAFFPHCVNSQKKFNVYIEGRLKLFPFSRGQRKWRFASKTLRICTFWARIFSVFALGIYLCKSWQLFNFKTRIGGEICSSDVNTHKGH